ncbi:YciI family protein [Bradyrhizobium genosp. A]|uniref:YciI family protein n=1 Tax=Bradyrhizobium genosp. A TaxID=83626 RepID=UPI003CF4FF0A
MQYSILYFDDEIETWARPWELRLSAGKGVKSRASIQLLPTAAALTLRKRHSGGSIVLDGPYAETRRQLLGIYLIDCVSLAEAIDVAKECPWARRGASFEIRPTVEVFL